ncbi:major facilitator superfamily protein [Halomonas elongata]|uniref:Major facilitator superfamily protein n=1 Tax=Halomonas elongata TaxID=2746 RepID=A0A1B8NVZ8_HALEL|nr:MFS transporter [Halomonas elongata]OBX34133.1 major facilitator superfamily protein [Halomonas elongata]
MAFSTLRSLMILSVVTYVPLMWTQSGGSLTTGASFITIMLVIGVIGNLGGGRLSDRFGRRALLVVAMSVAVIMLGAFLLASGIWLWIALGVLGICLFATLPLGILIAQDILPENRSLGSGMALGLSNALAALGVMGLGPVAAFWAPSTPLWIALIGGIVSVPLAIGLPEHEAPLPDSRRTSPAPPPVRWDQGRNEATGPLPRPRRFAEVPRPHPATAAS